jgi:hypothetical protein
MSHWLVRAKPRIESLPRLRLRLDSGRVRGLRPFGKSLDESLRRARAAAGVALWEEEDDCDPPLAEERAAVLDEHFEDIAVEAVQPGEAWRRIESLPSLWDRIHGTEPR